MDTELLCKEKTNRILKAFYQVYNTLGYGFLEKVYQNALFFELQQQGFDCKAQYPINVYYQKKKVGEFFADILVDDCIILELKATEKLCREHELQLINYLKATKIEIGLLLNFGENAEFRRKISTNPFNI